jgi:hypothetical protein
MAHFLLHKEANAINRSKKMRAPRGSKSKKKMREFISRPQVETTAHNKFFRSGSSCKKKFFRSGSRGFIGTATEEHFVVP